MTYIYPARIALSCCDAAHLIADLPAAQEQTPRSGMVLDPRLLCIFRPGSALDNAVIESWHSTLESGLRRTGHFTTRAQARARVAAWIEEYNTTRRHSACGMMPPVA
jgi:hypothetical protein